MSDARASATSSGAGFFGLLTIAFIVLKLTGFISWSWFWVLSPLIFSWTLGIILVVIAILVARWYDKTPTGALENYARSVSRRR